jgi:hypothetical protein
MNLFNATPPRMLLELPAGARVDRLISLNRGTHEHVVAYSFAAGACFSLGDASLGGRLE